MNQGIRTMYALVEETQSETWTIEGPDAAGLFLRVALAREQDHCLVAIGLDRGYGVVGCSVLARNSARVDRLAAGKVMAAVRAMGASRFILARTQFADLPLPSSSEVRIARMIGLAAELADLRIVDHIVVGEWGLYWSAWAEDAVDWSTTSRK